MGKEFDVVVVGGRCAGGHRLRRYWHARGYRLRWWSGRRSRVTRCRRTSSSRRRSPFSNRLGVLSALRATGAPVVNRGYSRRVSAGRVPGSRRSSAQSASRRRRWTRRSPGWARWRDDDAGEHYLARRRPRQGGLGACRAPGDRTAFVRAGQAGPVPKPVQPPFGPVEGPDASAVGGRDSPLGGAWRMRPASAAGRGGRPHRRGRPAKTPGPGTRTMSLLRDVSGRLPDRGRRRCCCRSEVSIPTVEVSVRDVRSRFRRRGRRTARRRSSSYPVIPAGHARPRPRRASRNASATRWTATPDTWRRCSISSASPRAHVVAHDSGGPWALAWAARHPGLAGSHAACGLRLTGMMSVPLAGGRDSSAERAPVPLLRFACPPMRLGASFCLPAETFVDANGAPVADVDQ